MKVLVTGASGFTGSHLVRALEQRGYGVVALVRRSSNLSRLAGCHPQLVYGDIADRDAVAAAMAGIDGVFHTAAYVDLGIVNESEMERVNVEGTRAVLDGIRAIAQRSGAVDCPRLVYCSTIGVFGDSGGAVIDETFQRQQGDFSSAYDRTKYLAQQLVDQFAEEGFPVVSILPSGILGPDDPHFGPVVQLFLKGRLKVWAGGDRITGIVHVDDLTDAMILALERGKPGEHYIVSAGDLSTREMFARMGQASGQAVPQEVPEVFVRVLGAMLEPIGRLFRWNPPLSRERVHYLYDRCVRVDGAKAQRDLGWQPRSVDAVLEDVVKAGMGSDMDRFATDKISGG